MLIKNQQFFVRKCNYQDFCKCFSILIGSWNERLVYLGYEKIWERKVESEVPYNEFSIVWEHRKSNF